MNVSADFVTRLLSIISDVFAVRRLPVKSCQAGFVESLPEINPRILGSEINPPLRLAVNVNKLLPKCVLCLMFVCVSDKEKKTRTEICLQRHALKMGSAAQREN